MTERPSMKTRARSGYWWLADIGGAAAFAFGFAAAIGTLVDGGAVPPGALAWMIAGGGIRAVSAWAAQAGAARTAQRHAALLRDRLFRRLLAQPLPRPIPIGESATIALDHSDRVEAHAARFLPVRLAAGIGPIATAGIVAFASPVAATILIGTLIPFVIGMIMAGTMAKRAADEQLRALEHLSDLFVDRLRNLAIIRHFGAGERITRQVGGATSAIADRTLAVLRIAFLSSAVMEFFAALSVALVAVYCGFSLLGLLPFPAPETLTFREALFALIMAPEFYLPMRRLAAAYHEKQLGEAARDIIDPLLAATPPAQSGHGAFAGLVADRVELRYPGAAIGPVSFELDATGLVALTGPTGSGKSSLLAACAGQVTPVRGTITPVIASDIAWAAQRPLILPGTLAENLALARPDASHGEIAEVCRLVGLDRMLAERPEGFDLMLDHNAASLSGGERRRLALARAILSRRPLLICDEPTADLDTESSAGITSLLVQLARTHAVLVATHDPVLAGAADHVVTL